MTLGNTCPPAPSCMVKKHMLNCLIQGFLNYLVMGVFLFFLGRILIFLHLPPNTHRPRPNAV